MEIRSSGIQGKTIASRARGLPVAVAPANDERVSAIAGAGAQNSQGKREKLLHHRPLAAFLAQLALQYDDISEARRARRALRQAAENHYAAPTAKHTRQELGAIANIKT